MIQYLYRANTSSKCNQLDMTTFEPSLSAAILLADRVLDKIGILAILFSYLAGMALVDSSLISTVR